jgi:Putative binding domain, N-terminal
MFLRRFRHTALELIGAAGAALLLSACTSLNDFASPSCNYGVTPTTATTGNLGGPATLAVHAAGVCSWEATNDLTWITLGATGGHGEGTLTYVVAPNSSSASRTGFFTVAGTRITVTQAAGPAPRP